MQSVVVRINLDYYTVHRVHTLFTLDFLAMKVTIDLYSGWQDVADGMKEINKYNKLFKYGTDVHRSKYIESSALDELGFNINIWKPRYRSSDLEAWPSPFFS